MSEYAILQEYYNKYNTIEHTKKWLKRRKLIKKIKAEIIDFMCASLIVTLTGMGLFIGWLIK